VLPSSRTTRVFAQPPPQSRPHNKTRKHTWENSVMVVVVEAIVSLSLLIYTVRAQPGQNSSLLEKKETRRRRRRSGQADNGRLLLRRSHNLRQTRSSSNPISRHRANGYRENTKIRSKRRNLSHTSSNSLEELWWGIHYIIVISHVKSRWCRSKLSSPEARARRLKYIQTLKRRSMKARKIRQLQQRRSWTQAVGHQWICTFLSESPNKQHFLRFRFRTWFHTSEEETAVHIFGV